MSTASVQKVPQTQTVSSHRAWMLTSLFLVTSLLLTSCATAPSNASSRRKQSPSHVALSFTQDLYGGRFVSAQQLVRPSNREEFQAVTDGLNPGSVRGSDIRTGLVQVAGNVATAVMLGTFCNTGNSRKLSSFRKGEFCKTNSDGTQLDPAFEVKLAKSSNGNWFIAFGP